MPHAARPRLFAGLGSVVYKEVFHVLRDPRSLFLILVIPGLDMALFGYAIDLEVDNVPVVVWNLDRRSESRALLDAIRNTGLFAMQGEVGSEQALKRALVSGEARVAIQIPPDFTGDLVAGRPATFQVLLDGSDSMVAMQAMQTLDAVALRRSLEMQNRTVDPGDLPVDARPRVLFNPELRTPNFMVPGLVAIIMQAITLMLTALSVVREKEAGTLEQLMVTPVSRLGLMLGKLLPYVAVACVETAIVVVLMVFLFQVPINGSVGLLALFSIPFLFTAIGMGLLTSTLTGNQMQALQVAMAFVLPAIVLSGFLFPRESMPLVINWLGYLFPATFFIEIIRGIVLRGAGFLDLWPEAAVLTLMGVAFLAVAASRFQKTLG